MEADFSGYATKAGLKCTDGRTIMPDAFKHQDQLRVPLVWQHGHTDPENVLGHAILENRPDGVYAYGFFNDSPKARHTASLVEHKDISMMSIWANDLIERGGRVIHGAIREVSLVLSGANPGAVIENVTIRHADGDSTELDSEAVITTGLEFELIHSSIDETDEETETEEETQTEEETEEEAIQHAATNAEDETVQDVWDSLSDKQKEVVHFMIGEAMASVEAEVSSNDNLSQSTDLDKDNDVKHNIFEDKTTEERQYISHEDLSGIVADAMKVGSLKDAVENYALSHGIENIDMLFPDAQALDAVPEYLKRRTEWVSVFMNAARKTPFSRIKTLNADLTTEEARAKGYITGSLKKEEFFSVGKRVTTPTTVYKKQKLDRDDLVDITDFDVVAWLKAEMRMMLDEEIARAALVGDGRDISSEDKINEQNIRPIALDHELYTTTLTVNIDDASSSVTEFIDAVILNRHKFKGSGSPVMFTTESFIARMQLLKDTLGRRIYATLDEIARELRVSQIVPAEVLEDPEYDDILAILVNPADYVFGATAGGQVSMFDDFDIDYNQHKYLIETRLAGALTKLKSAIVVKKTAGTNVLVTPAAPTFNPATGALTIVDTTGVVYKNSANATVNAAGSPYTVASGDTEVITATPATGYYFATSDDDSWSFTAD